MYNKKYYIGVLCLIFLFGISFVSAVKPTVIVTSDTGLVIVPVDEDYLRTGYDHSFHITVFNKSDGHPINSSIMCVMNLHGFGGEHIFREEDNTVEDQFTYSWKILGGNFTERTEYQVVFICYDDDIGGETSYFFKINDYGEKLSTAHSIKFNMAMVFLMMFFILGIVGFVMSDYYITKFVMYWICHLIFVVGSFSMWQFNQGFTITYIGLAGIWKVLFYVSITAVLPMILVSVAWIVYIHAYNEHFQKLIDKGEDTETAFAMTNKKKGWKYGN